MVELEGINIPIKVDASGVSAGLQQAGTEVKKFGDEVSGTAGTVKQSGTEMEGTFKGTASTVKQSGSEMQGSFKGMALSMSQTATSAFSLYQSFDNIEKKQYAVEKANLAAKRATEAVDQAQKDYNEAVEKYGADSAQAQDALDKLNLSKEAAELSDERARISQNNLNDSMMMAGLTVIPAVVSGIDGMGKMWKNFQGMDIGSTLGKVKEGLTSLGSDKAGLLFSVGAGVGALGLIFAAFTSKSPEVKLACSIIGGALVALAAKQWIMNIAATYGLGLTGAGLIFIGVAGAAAAATYVLSEMYGAKAEAPPEAPAAPPAAAGEVGGATVATAPGGEAVQGAEYTGLATSYLTIPAGTVDWERWQQARSYPEIEEASKWPSDAVFKQIGENAWLSRHGNVLTKEQVYMMLDIPTIGSIGSAALAADWADIWNEEGMRLNAHLRPPFYRFYGESGWAITPHLAVVAEKGPEVMLTESRLDDLAERLGGVGGGGNTYIFNINGAKDVDLIMNELAQKMRYRGVGH